MAPIQGLTAADAVEINRASTPFEGIRQIRPDGTAVFMPDTVAIMRDTLGYECEQLHPDDAGERGRELIRPFQEYARRHGVKL